MYNDFGIKQSKIWKRRTVCITIAANIAELAILDIDACFPDSVIGIVPNKKITSSEYLYFLLKYFQTYIKSKSKGTAQLNINLGTFENERFPFPRSLDVQDDIVNKIDKINNYTLDYINLKYQKINELNILKSSVIDNEINKAA